MEILTSVKRLYISFKSLVNDFVYSFGRAALLLLVEVYNHTVPVRERGRIRVNSGLRKVCARKSGTGTGLPPIRSCVGFLLSISFQQRFVFFFILIHCTYQKEKWAKSKCAERSDVVCCIRLTHYWL